MFEPDEGETTPSVSQARTGWSNWYLGDSSCVSVPLAACCRSEADGLDSIPLVATGSMGFGSEAGFGSALAPSLRFWRHRFQRSRSRLRREGDFLFLLTSPLTGDGWSLSCLHNGCPVACCLMGEWTMFSDSCPFHDFDKVHEIGYFPSSKTRITRKNTSGKISGLLKVFSMIFYVKSRELILTRPSPTTVRGSLYVYHKNERVELTRGCGA